MPRSSHARIAYRVAARWVEICAGAQSLGLSRAKSHKGWFLAVLPLWVSHFPSISAFPTSKTDLITTGVFTGFNSRVTTKCCGTAGKLQVPAGTAGLSHRRLTPGSSSHGALSWDVFFIPEHHRLSCMT